jgi:ribosomal protein L34
MGNQLAFSMPDQSPKPCECGCGAPAPIANRTRRGLGHVKGEPIRFIQGHHARTHSYRARMDSPTRLPNLAAAAARRIKDAAEIDYSALHKWLRRHLHKTGACEECGAIEETEWSLIGGRQYSRDRSDYRELCRPCHRTYDAREAPRKRTHG